MNKWQLTRYLIDAKKCIDSLLYIEKNKLKLSNLDLKEIIDNKLRHFYINLCIIFDYSIRKKELKQLKEEDPIINGIYYERDKNFAHKDADYEKTDFKQLMDIIEKLKGELENCKEICKAKLPDVITIDYVAYDKNLFRYVNQISVELENKIRNLSHGEKYSSVGKHFKTFNDTEDIKSVKNISDYGVVLQNGLTLKECIQNHQDSLIRANVLFGTDTWCHADKGDAEIFEVKEKDFLNAIETLR